jgi:RNase H-fold protein (predicted Holliday junction resolvase)
MTILGFDPGRDKCGVAVRGNEGQLYYHQVVTADVAIATILDLLQQFSFKQIVMGDQTTAKIWQQKLKNHLPVDVSIILVDERNSSLEARDRYWEMYPPKGLQRFIPQGMRLPPRPVDDIVAILLIERYLNIS